MAQTLSQEANQSGQTGTVVIARRIETGTAAKNCADQYRETATETRPQRDGSRSHKTAETETAGVLRSEDERNHDKAQSARRQQVLPPAGKRPRIDRDTMCKYPGRSVIEVAGAADEGVAHAAAHNAGPRARRRLRRLGRESPCARRESGGSRRRPSIDAGSASGISDLSVGSRLSNPRTSLEIAAGRLSGAPWRAAAERPRCGSTPTARGRCATPEAARKARPSRRRRRRLVGGR